MATNVLVVPYQDELADSMLKRLKKHMLKEGVFKEVRRHDYYLKPGERRRLKSKLARAKVRKAKRAWIAAEAEWIRRTEG